MDFLTGLGIWLLVGFVSAWLGWSIITFTEPHKTSRLEAILVTFVGSLLGFISAFITLCVIVYLIGLCIAFGGETLYEKYKTWFDTPVIKDRKND